jgi:hypothetical protein
MLPSMSSSNSRLHMLPSMSDRAREQPAYGPVPSTESGISFARPETLGLEAGVARQASNEQPGEGGSVAPGAADSGVVAAGA